jgi:hypothetical protein
VRKVVARLPQAKRAVIWSLKDAIEIPPLPEDTPNFTHEEFIGEGEENKVYAYPNNRVVAFAELPDEEKGVPESEAKASEGTLKKYALLEWLKERGFRTVEQELIAFDGKPAIVMPRYAAESHGEPEEAKKFYELLNQKSIEFLRLTIRLMEEQQITVLDLQLLIANDGDLVLADPNDITVGGLSDRDTYESHEDNIRTLEEMIDRAERNEAQALLGNKKGPAD